MTGLCSRTDYCTDYFLILCLSDLNVPYALILSNSLILFVFIQYRHSLDCLLAFFTAGKLEEKRVSWQNENIAYVEAVYKDEEVIELAMIIAHKRKIVRYCNTFIRCPSHVAERLGVYARCVTAENGAMPLMNVVNAYLNFMKMRKVKAIVTTRGLKLCRLFGHGRIKMYDLQYLRFPARKISDAYKLGLAAQYSRLVLPNNIVPCNVVNHGAYVPTPDINKWTRSIHGTSLDFRCACGMVMESYCYLNYVRNAEHLFELNL